MTITDRLTLSPAVHRPDPPGPVSHRNRSSCHSPSRTDHRPLARRRVACGHSPTPRHSKRISKSSPWHKNDLKIPITTSSKDLRGPRHSDIEDHGSICKYSPSACLAHVKDQNHLNLKSNFIFVPFLHLLVLSMEALKTISQGSTKSYSLQCFDFKYDTGDLRRYGPEKKEFCLHLTCHVWSFCAKLLGHSPLFCASHLAQAAHHAESTSRKWIRLAVPLSKEGRPAQTVISEFASPNVTGDSASG